MFQCPHCLEDGITSFRKFFATWYYPAFCKNCGKPSGIKRGLRRLLGGIIYLAYLVPVILVFVMRSFMPLFLLIPIFVLPEFILFKFARLVPYTGSDVIAAKIRLVVTLLALCLLLIFSYNFFLALE